MLWNILSAISNIVLAIAAIIGVIIAKCGLSTWRHELKGQFDLVVARRVMQLVYEVRNQIRQLRSSPLCEICETHYKRLNKTLCKLDVALLEAEVLWGERLNPAKQLLKDCILKYDLSVIRYKLEQKRHAKVNEEESKKAESILWGNHDQEDQFWQSIKHAVSEFENVLRPYLNKERQITKL
jgi:hypothetical protein